MGAVYGIVVSPDGRSVYAATSFDSVVRLTRKTTTGAISQPSGTAGCVDAGEGPCATGRGLLGAGDVTVSPNGASVYVASPENNAVAHFERNMTTGAITQPVGTAGCISETASEGCADGHGLVGPERAVVSPGGKTVYVASIDSNAVARLSRDVTTGAITQPVGTAGCVSQTGAGPCVNGRALFGAGSVAISPKGKSVYIASVFSDAVARFVRPG
jgi:DNA-binding beta-propeller fold protein YncE